MFIASYPLNERQSRVYRDKSHAWIDQSFNEPMVLFHNIIEVLDSSEFSSFTEEFGLSFSESIAGGNRCILIHIYDSR